MNAPALPRRLLVGLLGGVSCLLPACGSPPKPAESLPRPSVTPSSARTVPETTKPPPVASADKGVPEASGRNVNDVPSVGEPKAVEIPSIGVRSDLLRLGKASDGTAQVPADPQRAGWFSGGARPGDEGPAVILGHIDSRTGPAVFFRLHELARGAQVTVDTAQGGRVAFTVDRVEQVAKDAFPTGEVYGPAFGRQLRLITCGGSFDRAKGHYRDNVIVFLTASKRPGQP